MSIFIPDTDAVIWVTGDGPIRLNHRQCDQMLDLFEEVGCSLSRHLHADLYEAFVRSGGCERVSSLRAA